MRRKINFTEKDVIDAIRLYEAGHTYGHIGFMAGVSADTVKRYIKRYKQEHGMDDAPTAKAAPAAPQAKKEAVPPVPPVPRSSTTQVERNTQGKEWSLANFSSRQLIKELYNRGYRIENGALFVIEKKKVLLNDILAAQA